MSAGNDTVGEMWEETKIFSSEEPIINIFAWSGLHKKVTITISENDQAEFRKYVLEYNASKS